MTNNTSSSMFTQALLDSVVNEYADVPSESELSHSFADKIKFPERKRPLSVRRYLRTVALIAVLISAFLCGSMFANYNDPVQVGLVLHHNGERYSFTAETQNIENLPKQLSPQCPEYIPDGYKLSLSDFTSNAVFQYYSCGDSYISYAQHTLSSDPDAEYGFSIYGETVSISQIEINDTEAYYLVDEDCGDINIVWTSDKYIYYLKFFGDLDNDEIEHVFKSIRPCEDVPIVSFG